MRILVTGATGYIGGRLVPELLKAGHDVRCIVRDPARIEGRFEGVEIVRGDIFEGESLDSALAECEVAYYLVHSMSDERHDFTARDRVGARLFAAAAANRGVSRIIYMGGLGDETATQPLSPHLRSRHEVGNELRSGGVPVTEFRAAIIVGAGSVSFEMLRYLTERLPVMIAPKWVRTRCQPIGIRDVIAYLVAALGQPASAGRIVEIGGSDVLEYRDMMLRYAAIRGLARRIIIVPVFSPQLSSRWIHLVTPVPASIARPLVEGLFNEVVVRSDTARVLFPQIEPPGYEIAVRRALDRYASTGPSTTWFDAFHVKTLPGEFSGSEEGMLIDRRQRKSRSSASSVAAVFSSLGGEKGWLYADGLWELRGFLDRLAGGIGTRRGRRSSTSLRIGDAVDFWRVEVYHPGEVLRLRAEMKLPGYAWLQFEALAAGDGGAILRQTAFFDPRGIFGFLYWFAVLPFHELIFGGMASEIVREAEKRSGVPAIPAPGARRSLVRPLLAGVAASFAMDVVQDGFDRAFERKRSPNDRDEETEAIVSTVRLIARALPFLREARRSGVAGRAIHYIAGAAFAGGYARLRERYPRASTAGGLAFGAALWLASDIVLIPALHLGRPLARYTMAQRLNALVAHLAYGVTVERCLGERKKER